MSVWSTLAVGLLYAMTTSNLLHAAEVERPKETERFSDSELNEMLALINAKSHIISVAMSPDGRRLASGDISDDFVRIWNPASGSQVATLEGHTDTVLSVAFSPDGKRLASGSRDKTVRIWDVETGQSLTTLEGHTDVVSTVAFSPDGKRLASGSHDKLVRIWDIATGRLLSTLGGHTNWVNSIAFSPDGKQLASGSQDTSIRVWDVTKGMRLATLGGHNAKLYGFGPSGIVASVAYSPDGDRLAAGHLNNNNIWIWSTVTGELFTAFEGHKGHVFSVVYSPDGRRLASGSEDGTVKIWDPVAGKQVATLEGHKDNYVNSVVYSPDGRRLASGSHDGTIRIWDPITQQVITTLGGTASPVVYSPDCDRLAWGAWDESAPENQNLTGARAETGDLFVSCSREAVGWLCQRQDDGTIFVRQYENGARTPVFPSWWSEQIGDITVAVPDKLTVKEARPEPLALTLRNESDENVHWIRINHTLPWNKENTNPLIFYPPPPVIELKAKEEVTLDVRVSATLGYENPEEQLADLTLDVTSARVKPKPVNVSVHVQAPQLKLMKSEVKTQEDGIDVLSVEVANIGGVSLPVALFRAQLFDRPVDPLTVDWIDKSNQLDAVGVNEIGAGKTRQITFALQEEKLPQGTPHLLLIAQWNQPVNHAWRFPPMSVEIGLPPYTWIGLSVITILLVLGGFAYLRIFRHPFVIQLSHDPSALLSFYPIQLAQVRQVLSRAHRLDGVLAGIDVSRAQLDRAVAAVKVRETSALMKLISERVMGSFETVMSEPVLLYKLQLGPNFPLNLTHCMVAFPDKSLSPQEVIEQISRVRSLSDQITVIFSAVPDQCRAISQKAKGQRLILIVPPGNALTRLLLDQDPNRILSQLIASDAPLTNISPYQTKGGLERAAVFFGRDKLLTHVLSRDLTNYFVVGGRQLGKSSLLKAIERRYQNDPQVDARYISLSVEKVFEVLAEGFDIPWRGDEGEILEQLGKVPEGRTRLLLLDEVDLFVKADAGRGFQTLRRFRNLSESGRCHFILAGYWELFEQVSLDYQSPIKNFGDVLSIGALEPEACRQLATVPMEAMNIRFQDHSLVDRLVSITGGRANLIAITCNEILKSLSREARTIDEDDLEQALDSDAILESLSGWGALLGRERESETRLDRIIVYATVEQSQFTKQALLSTFTALNIDVDAEEIERSLKRLELAFILGRKKSTYSYQVPLFREMVLEDGCKEKLKMELRR